MNKKKNDKDKVKKINEYKKRKKNRYRKRRMKKMARKFIVAFFLIAIVIVNLCGNAVVSNYKYKINDLKEDLRKQEIILDELKTKQTSKKSINSIEKRAKEELNMDYPTENQKRYLDLN